LSPEDFALTEEIGFGYRIAFIGECIGDVHQAMMQGGSLMRTAFIVTNPHSFRKVDSL
jgi:hypothetical protein